MEKFLINNSRTTGLADPGPVLHSLIYNDYLKSLVRLERVIITVDAVTGLESIKRFDECQQQIALADVLLITKSDIDSSNVKDLKNKLKRINPEATVYTSNSGRTELIFSLTGRDTYKAVSNMSHQTHHHHHAQ